MKRSLALAKVKDGDVEGARALLEYLEKRNGLRPTDKAVYKYVRRHTGLAVDEWQELLDQVET